MAQASNLTPEQLRIYTTRIDQIVSIDDLQSLRGVPPEEHNKIVNWNIGATIDIARPEVSFTPSQGDSLPNTRMHFKLTEQGWKRVWPPKPSCLTPFLAWGIGGLILFVRLGRQMEGKSSEELWMMILIICIPAGFVVWGWDWSSYKKEARIAAKESLTQGIQKM